MYEYRPKRNNKKAALTTFLLSLIAVICFFSTGLLGAYAVAAELIALAAMIAAILVAGRYLLKDYIYELTETEDGVDFTVTEVQGRRRTVVCRIGVDEIGKTVTETPETRSFVKECLKDVKLYDHCVDLAPDTSLYLFFEDRDRTVAVRISPDERMRSLLMALSGAADGEETKE